MIDAIKKAATGWSIVSVYGGHSWRISHGATVDTLTFPNREIALAQLENMRLRAIVAAMREPTPAMLAHGGNKFLDVGSEEARVLWQLMIDALTAAIPAEGGAA